MRTHLILCVATTVLLAGLACRAEDDAKRTLSEALTAPTESAEPAESTETQPADDEAGVPRPPYVMEPTIRPEESAEAGSPVLASPPMEGEEPAPQPEASAETTLQPEQTTETRTESQTVTVHDKADPLPATPPAPKTDYVPTDHAAPAPPPAETTPGPLEDTHVVLLMDRSASMVGHIEWVKSEVLESLSKRLGRSCRVKIVTFDGTFEPIGLSGEFCYPYETSRMDLQHLQDLRAAGNTDIVAGLSRAYEELASAGAGRRAILLYSDGLFRSNAAVWQCVKRHDPNGEVAIHGLLFGEAVPRAHILRKLSEQTGGRFTHVTAQR